MIKNKIAINMLASIAVFIANLVINFFLSPYIIKNIGIEAYGFVALSNNFISYISLITIALNSMSNRFISISIYKKDYKSANEYYSSNFFANLFFVLVLFIPSILVVLLINRIVNVPSNILFDVKILMSFLFLNFFIGLLTINLGVSYFITNKLYLNSFRTIESSLLRIVVIILLFIYFVPRVSYLGISAFITLIYNLIFNIYYKRKLLPELTIKLDFLKKEKIKELIASGAWNTFIRSGQLLLEGFDLLLANLFLGPTIMGVLALSKTIPGIISSLLAQVVSVFMPNLTELYAENRKNEFIRLIKQSMKILSIMTNIPIILLIIFGKDFYNLWQPTQNASFIQILSIISASAYIVSGPINIIFNIFTITNRLKVNSISVFASGLLNIIIVYIL